MADGKAWQWKFFEDMYFTEYLILMEFQKDKQDEQEKQRLLRQK